MALMTTIGPMRRAQASELHSNGSHQHGQRSGAVRLNSLFLTLAAHHMEEKRQLNYCGSIGLVYLPTNALLNWRSRFSWGM